MRLRATEKGLVFVCLKSILHYNGDVLPVCSVFFVEKEFIGSFFWVGASKRERHMTNTIMNRFTWVALLGSLCASEGRADYQATVVSQDPLAYFRLNDTTPSFPDTIVATTNSGSLGTSANGPFSGSFTRGVAGAIEGDSSTAINFFGGGAYVPYSASLNPSGPFAVEFWVKPAGLNTGSTLTCPVGSLKIDGNGRLGWLFYQSASGWNFRVGSTTGYTGNLTGGTVKPNEWQHVVGVYDGTSAYLYVDGVQVGTGSVASFTPNPGDALGIGARGDTGFLYYGTLDEVAVYGASLTSDDVQAHYQNARNANRTTSYASLVQTKNPLGYWHLDEPAYNPPKAVNLGKGGSALDATYVYPVTVAAEGPRPATYPLFEANNTAVSIDGTNGNVSIPSINTVTNRLTITCWVKPHDPASYSGIVFHRGTSVCGMNFRSNGELGYHWNDASSTYSFSSQLFAPNDVWTFVALAVEPGKATLYMHDGSTLQKAENIVDHGLATFNTIFWIGRDQDAARVLNGSVDEVAIFDRTLTEGEIQRQYLNAVGSTAPMVIAEPVAPTETIYTGGAFTLSVDAAGTDPVTYQWYRDGAQISGATNSTYVVTNASTAMAGTYTVTIHNAFGDASTSGVVVDISPSTRPVITQQPYAGTRYVGGRVTMSVLASGTPPLTYQWSHAGTAIAGATNATLTLTNLQSSDAGSYVVTVSNVVGPTPSVATTLNVLTPAVGSYAKTIMAQSPMAYWRLGETGEKAIDYAGGNDGLYVSVTQKVPGALKDDSDGAASFDGASSYVTTVTNLLGNLPAFTVAGWVKRGENHSTRGGYFGQNDLLEFGDASSGASVEAYISTGGSITTPYTFADNEWGLIVLTADGTNNIMYFNGKVVKTSTQVVTSYGSSPYAFNIGGGGVFNATGDFFLGDIDEVAVFNHAISASAVTDLYCAGHYGPNAVPVIVDQPTEVTLVSGFELLLQMNVGGSPSFEYQWKMNGQSIEGATNSQYRVPSSTTANSGAYTLVIKNAKGEITSQPIAVTVLPAPQYANITNDLVLHLNFEGDYKDTSGRGNDGTAVGAPEFVTGKVGAKALKYSTDTSSQTYNYVTLGVPEDLQFVTNDFTVALWIRYTGSPGDLPYLCTAVNSYGSYGLTFAPSYQRGGWSWYLKDDANGVGLYSPDNVINDGKWHHLVHAFTRGAFGVTYLDGVKVDETSIATITGSLSNGEVMNIGQDPTGTYAETATAEVDDMGIWRRALARYEAESIYTVGAQYGRSFDVPAPDMPKMSIVRMSSGKVEIRWESGTLESTSTIANPASWSTVTGAQAPVYEVTPTPGATFYRVRR